jgi:methyl-accepting chemotaxis protein
VKNLSIVGKFLIVLGVFGVFVVATTIYMTTEMRGLTTGFMQDDKSAQAAAFYASEASQAASGMAADIGWLVVADDAAGKQTMEGRLSRNQALFDSALSNAAAALPARASEFEAVRQSGDTAYTTRACAQAVALGEEFPRPSGLIAANGGVFSGCEDSFMPPILALGKAVAESRMDAIHNETALTNKSGGTVFNPFALVLAGLVAVLVGGFFAVRAWVVTPIKGLQATMGKLTGGNLQASVAGVERRDEIGGMARAVHVFKDAGIEKLRLEAEAAAQRQAAEQERERTEAERAAAAKQQEFVVHSVATGLEKLSSGDLMFRLTTAFGGDYEKLRGDFNAAMEKLQETMQSIAANTQGVRSGAEEITQASDDLSRRTEQQAASLEETAAALDQITATVRRTADVANEARNLVSTSKEDAEHSGAVVRQTVGADGRDRDLVQCRRGSGARWRCRARLCRGGDRSAGAGAALRRCRQGDQGADLDLNAAGRDGRKTGERNQTQRSKPPSRRRRASE